MPFAGPMSIINLIKHGTTEVTTSNHIIISLDQTPYKEKSATQYLRFLSGLFYFIYFFSIIFCCFLPAFAKGNTKRIYIWGIASCITAVLISVVGGLIWRHLVKLYLGI
ncbi:MAG: hypothetical protein C0191_05685 [Mucilaginibacter sp.]|nr:MAG: hypothetical protein C0191_05685 [Mucilaginibacter sp.]